MSRPGALSLITVPSPPLVTMNQEILYDPLPQEGQRVLSGLLRAQPGDVILRTRDGVSLGRAAPSLDAEIISRYLDGLGGGPPGPPARQSWRHRRPDWTVL